MKISKKQLRSLIEATIKPKNPFDYIDDASTKENIQGLIDSGEESFINMGYELSYPSQKIKPNIHQPEPESFTALDFGYEGDNYPEDHRNYQFAHIISEIREIAQYLTEEDLEMINNIRGRELSYGLFGHAGFGFQFQVDGKYAGVAIGPNDLHSMVIRIAAKKKNITQNDIIEHEGMDTEIDAHHKIATTIMKLSEKTYVSPHGLEDAGIAETPDVRSNEPINFYVPEYEKLYKSGKLVITGI